MTVAVGMLLIAVACEKENVIQSLQAVDDAPVFMKLPVLDQSNGRVPQVWVMLCYSAEYFTSGESGQVGRTVYFNNVGNKQLTQDFVPGSAWMARTTCRTTSMRPGLQMIYPLRSALLPLAAPCKPGMM